MKRKAMIMALSLVILSIGARAQYSDWYYHRTYDTIEWKAPNGYYSWWEFEAYHENNLTLSIKETHAHIALIDSSELLMYFYTPVPLKIVGLAGTCYRGIYENYHLVIDTDGCQEYFLLYDAVGDSFPLMGRLPWNPFDPHRTLHVKLHGDRDDCEYSWGGVGALDSCCNICYHEQYVPIYEYYFDSAIYVNDSFYVGGTCYGISWKTNLGRITTYGTASTDRNLGYIVCNSEYQSNGMGGIEWSDWCQPFNIKHKWKVQFNPHTGVQYNTFQTTPWYWPGSRNHLDVLLIYPIIEVDTTVPPEDACVPVGNVEVFPSGSSAMVTWDDFPNYTAVTLRYGHINVPQNQWTSVDVTGQAMYTITGLSMGSMYGVSLQSECDKTLMPWSHTVSFYIANDTNANDSTGIAEPTLLSQLTFLQPNPARDEVHISSSFNLQRLELHDAAGVLVYSEPVFGHMVTIDVSKMRSGTYIMTIHTKSGTTHKRLVIVH